LAVPILVDGHNLIGRLPGVSLQDPDDEYQLIHLLRSYQARVGKRVTIVFDPGPGAGLQRVPSSDSVQVLFAPRESTADALIANRVRATRDPGAWLVITSDRELADLVRGLGARVRSSDEFASDLGLDDKESDWRDSPLTSAEIEEWQALFEDRD
jgi:predicted RNA-binding protein with PIN domain